MRATSFKALRNSVLRKMGLDADQLVLPSQAAAIADYMESSLSDVWGLYDWPDTTLTETRTPTGTPATSIDFRAPGATSIGTILRITDQEPTSARLVQTFSFAENALSTAAIITDARYTPGTAVHVKFRLPEPRLTSTAYNGTVGYNKGDLVYYEPTGDCYVSIFDGFSTLPAPTNAAFWERQLIPSIFAPYLRHATHALTLEEDGQYDKAAVQSAKAENEIVKTHDDIFLRENNTPLRWTLQRDTVTPY